MRKNVAWTNRNFLTYLFTGWLNCSLNRIVGIRSHDVEKLWICMYVVAVFHFFVGIASLVHELGVDVPYESIITEKGFWAMERNFMHVGYVIRQSSCNIACNIACDKRTSLSRWCFLATWFLFSIFQSHAIVVDGCNGSGGQPSSANISKV